MRYLQWAVIGLCYLALLFLILLHCCPRLKAVLRPAFLVSAALVLLALISWGILRNFV